METDRLTRGVLPPGLPCSRFYYTLVSFGYRQQTFMHRTVSSYGDVTPIFELVSARCIDLLSLDCGILCTVPCGQIVAFEQ